MEENNKRLIVFSILAYAVGTFIFDAGLSIKTPISIVTFFIIIFRALQMSMNTGWVFSHRPQPAKSK